MRLRTKIFISVLILIAFVAIWLRLSFPTVTYRYRLTVNVEVDGQVRTGSSVIEMKTRFNPGWAIGPPANAYVRGQAAIIDLGPRGVLVAALGGESYDRCTVDARYLAGRAFEPANPRRVCATGYPQSLDNERAIARTKEPVDLTPDNLPLFIWFGDKSDLASAKLAKPDRFASVIGDTARFLSAQIQITDDPIVINRPKNCRPTRRCANCPTGETIPRPAALASRRPCLSKPAANDERVGWVEQA